MVKVGYSISYNIEDMNVMNEKFKSILHALEELCDKGASKLGIYEDKLYVSVGKPLISTISTIS